MYFIWGPGAEPQSPALTAFLKFWSFIIIFTNFVPISLLVTLDMVKMFQSKIIGWDREIYYEAQEFDGTRRPMPAQVGLGLCVCLRATEDYERTCVHITHVPPLLRMFATKHTSDV